MVADVDIGTCITNTCHHHPQVRLTTIPFNGHIHPHPCSDESSAHNISDVKLVIAIHSTP